jgi:hypothetical protein
MGILLISAFSSMAQIGVPFQNAVWRSSPESVEGSPFLEENWRMGTIMDSKNQQEYQLFLKYDTHIDRIVISAYGRPAVLSDERYPIFTIASSDNTTSSGVRKFVNASLLNHPQLEGYYEILYEGRYRMLQKIYTDYMPNTLPAYGTNKKVILYLTRESSFLLSPTGHLFQIPGRENQIFRLFEEDESKARSIAERNSLDVEVNGDLITLLSLLENAAITN